MPGSDLVGIGLTAERQISGDHFIVDVKSGSAAEEAGLTPGCIIKSVDFRQIKGSEAAEVRSLIMGPSNTSVTLTIQRPGARSFEHVLVFRRDIRSHSQDRNQFPAKGTAAAAENALRNATGFLEKFVGISAISNVPKSAQQYVDQPHFQQTNQNTLERNGSELGTDDKAPNEVFFYEPRNVAPPRVSNDPSADVDAIVEELMRRRTARFAHTDSYSAIYQQDRAPNPHLNGGENAGIASLYSLHRPDGPYPLAPSGAPQDIAPGAIADRHPPHRSEHAAELPAPHRLHVGAREPDLRPRDAGRPAFTCMW